MDAIIYWFKPRFAYLLLLYFVKLQEWSIVTKPTILRAKYDLWMAEKSFDLNRKLDVWASAYAYPKIYNIRKKYDEIYELLDQAERFKIPFPLK